VVYVTLTIFVAVVAYILLLIVVIGSAAGTARHFWVLEERIDLLEERIDTLSKRVDAACHATQIVPNRIVDAYKSTLHKKIPHPKVGDSRT
jgi:hypothetical protein